MEIEELSDELIQYGFDHQMQDLYLLPQKISIDTFFAEAHFMSIRTQIFPMLIMK